MEKNWSAHQVTPQEAGPVFFNRPLIVADDAKHSRAEKRYLLLGQTDKNRFLFIAFTMRKRRIRIISARDMSRKERKAYLL
ncbi:MAG: BrnT family toxin [Kiritimatiellia bacterium]